MKVMSWHPEHLKIMSNSVLFTWRLDKEKMLQIASIRIRNVQKYKINVQGETTSD